MQIRNKILINVLIILFIFSDWRRKNDGKSFVLVTSWTQSIFVVLVCRLTMNKERRGCVLLSIFLSRCRRFPFYFLVFSSLRIICSSKKRPNNTETSSISLLSFFHELFVWFFAEIDLIDHKEKLKTELEDLIIWLSSIFDARCVHCLSVFLFPMNDRKIKGRRLKRTPCDFQQINKAPKIVSES